MREQIYVYDRNGYQVPNSAGALAHVRNLSWRTQIPGGYADLSCEVPLWFARGWDVGLAYKLKVYDGLHELFCGRIEDLTRQAVLPGHLHNGWCRVQAFGYNQEAAQRLYSANFANGTVYADDILRDIAAQCLPHISVSPPLVQSPGFNLAPISWSNVWAQSVIDQLLKYGDTQSPPRKWYWAVWGEQNTWVAIIYSDWHSGATGNTPIDPAWSGKVTGQGSSIAMSGANLRISTPTAVDRAAMIVSASPLPSDKAWRIECKFNAVQTLHWMVCLGVAQAAVQPAPGPGLRYWPTILVRQHRDGLRIMYLSPGGGTNWWTGAAWEAGDPKEADACVAPQGNDYTAILTSTDTGWYITILNAAGAVLTTTSAILWSNTLDNSLPSWIVIGDPATDWQYGYVDVKYVRVYAPANRPLAEFWPRDLSTFDVQIPLGSISGNMEITDTAGEIANSVVASYGSPVAYTAAAKSSRGIADHDQRDTLVAVGNVALGLAEKARDVKLATNKLPGQRLSPFSIRGDVRDRLGARYPLNYLRAGKRFIIPELSGAVYIIGRTDYNADRGEMSITIDGAPSSVDMLLAQLAKASR